MAGLRCARAPPRARDDPRVGPRRGRRHGVPRGGGAQGPSRARRAGAGPRSAAVRRRPRRPGLGRLPAAGGTRGPALLRLRAAVRPARGPARRPRGLAHPHDRPGVPARGRGRRRARLRRRGRRVRARARAALRAPAGRGRARRTCPRRGRRAARPARDRGVVVGRRALRGPARPPRRRGGACRLARRRSAALEARAAALLALGDDAGALSWTAGGAAGQPLSERIWTLHALALYRSGRQVEALDALRTLRTALADELGLDPSAAARSLEQAILRQDAALRAPCWPVPCPGRRPCRPRRRPQPRPTVRSPRLRRPAPRDAGRARAGAGRPARAARPGDAGTDRRGRRGRRARCRQERPAAHCSAPRPGAGSCREGRCSQDDAPPPLWPFLAVLRGLDAAVSTLADLVPDGAPAPAFDSWERIAGEAVSAAGRRPALLVLMTCTGPTRRCCVSLVNPGDDGAGRRGPGGGRDRAAAPGAVRHAGAGREALGRRQSLRLDLAGLDLAASCERADGQRRPGRRRPGRAAAPPVRREPVLPGRARTARSHRRAAVPGGVLDVVRRRLDAATATQELLRAAAVAGRSFPGALAAAGLDRPPDDVAAALEQAAAAGLVRETGADSWGFVHALTRAAVLQTLPASQSARRDARLAQLLEGSPEVRALVEPDERTAELARHWARPGRATRPRWPAPRRRRPGPLAVGAHRGDAVAARGRHGQAAQHRTLGGEALDPAARPRRGRCPRRRLDRGRRRLARGRGARARARRSRAGRHRRGCDHR